MDVVVELGSCSAVVALMGGGTGGGGVGGLWDGAQAVRELQTTGVPMALARISSAPGLISIMFGGGTFIVVEAMMEGDDS